MSRDSTVRALQLIVGRELDRASLMQRARPDGTPSPGVERLSTVLTGTAAALRRASSKLAEAAALARPALTSGSRPRAGGSSGEQPAVWVGIVALEQALAVATAMIEAVPEDAWHRSALRRGAASEDEILVGVIDELLTHAEHELDAVYALEEATGRARL